MIEHITPNRIANSILQKIRFKGTYLIVEGNNDYAVFRKFTSREFCSVEIAFGSNNVIEVVQELQARGFQDVLGLIDADFRRLEDEAIKNNDILMTDEHDLELMILKSPAFEAVLEHHAEQRKIADYVMSNKISDLLGHLLKIVEPLGYLKLSNKMYNYGLLFKPNSLDGKYLNYSEFVSVKTLSFLGYEMMIETVFNYSMPKVKVRATKKDALDNTVLLNKTNLDLFQLCNGHDVCHVICLGLRKAIGSNNSNAIPVEQLETELVFAYDSRYFQKTDLYESIKNWEKQKGKSILSF